MRTHSENDFATPCSDFATASSHSTLANEKPVSDTTPICWLANEITGTTADDEWVRVAPYGTTEHRGNGKLALQLFNSEAARQIVDSFTRRVKDMASKGLRGAFRLPIFVGHPDNAHWVAANAARVDDRAYGWIDDLEARDDGLYMRPKWSEAGKALLSNAHYRYLSPNWIARQLGGAKYQPFELMSVGLVNHPNIAGDAIANEQPTTTIMNKYLTALLAALGYDAAQTEAIANEASDAPALDEVVGKVKTLANERDDATANLANEQTAHEATQAALDTKTEALNAQVESLANERAERVKLVADNAVLAGLVTFAERETLANELTADFEGRSATLANQKPKLKTERRDITGGDRRGTDGAPDVLALANEYIDQHKLDPRDPNTLPDAFAAVRRSNPELFEPKG